MLRLVIFFVCRLTFCRLIRCRLVFCRLVFCRLVFCRLVCCRLTCCRLTDMDAENVQHGLAQFFSVFRQVKELVSTAYTHGFTFMS